MEEMTEMGRPAKYSDAAVDRAVAMRMQGATYEAIFAETGIPKGTASSPSSIIGQRLTDARRATETSAQGIRPRLLEVVGESPRMDSISLTSAMRTRYHADYSLHEVQHVLGQLHRQGAITYIEQQNGNQKTYRRIELSRQNGRAAIDDAIAVVNVVEGGESIGSAAYRRAETPLSPFELDDMPDDPSATFEAETAETNAATAAAQDEIDATRQAPPAGEEATPPPEPEPVVATDASLRWPVLEGLREQEAARAETVRRASAYMDAAAALDSVDPEQARALSDKASQLADSVHRSPVEAEYLAYASSIDDYLDAKYKRGE